MHHIAIKSWHSMRSRLTLVTFLKNPLNFRGKIESSVNFFGVSWSALKINDLSEKKNVRKFGSVSPMTQLAVLAQKFCWTVESVSKKKSDSDERACDSERVRRKTAKTGRNALTSSCEGGEDDQKGDQSGEGEHGDWRGKGWGRLKIKD